MNKNWTLVLTITWKFSLIFIFFLTVQFTDLASFFTNQEKCYSLINQRRKSFVGLILASDIIIVLNKYSYRIVVQLNELFVFQTPGLG